MTAEARALVRASWDALAGDAAAGDAARLGALGERFYERLFALDAGVRPLFAAADMAAQQAKLVAMLGAMVRVLDDPDRLVPTAAALAARHVGYGVRGPHYALVGEALRGALGDVLGARATPAVLAAWGEAYALLAAVMRRSADAVHQHAVHQHAAHQHAAGAAPAAHHP